MSAKKRAQTFTIDGFTQDGEQWAFIPEYPKYFVSDAGRVYNGATGKEVTGSYNKHGYHYVELRNDDNKHNKHGKVVRVSHLVAAAFITGFKKGMLIHHINCNNSDDRAINLLPVTLIEHLIIHTLYKRVLKYPSLIVELFKRKKPELQILIRSNNGDDDMKGGDAA